MFCNRRGYNSFSPRLKLHYHGAFLCGSPDHWRDLVTHFMREGLATSVASISIGCTGHGRCTPCWTMKDCRWVTPAKGRLAIEPATDNFLTDCCLDAEATLAKLSRLNGFLTSHNRKHSYKVLCIRLPQTKSE